MVNKYHNKRLRYCHHCGHRHPEKRACQGMHMNENLMDQEELRCELKKSFDLMKQCAKKDIHKKKKTNSVSPKLYGLLYPNGQKNQTQIAHSRMSCMFG